MPINKNNIGFVIRLIGVLIVTIHIFSLVGAAQTSTLEVISDPGGANVYVDDVYKGQTNIDLSPFYIYNIPYGSHIIRIGKSGCNDWSQTYLISAPTTSVLAPLTCPPLLGTFIINSIPDGGGIYIDDDFKNFTPKTILVPYGSHTVKIVKSGYQDWIQNWLAGASPQTITAYLVPLPDTILPTISISSPYSGQSFTTNTITVSGTASDNVGLSKVEVKVGSGSWQLASGTTSWSKQVTLSSGSNTIYARATDTSGNTAEGSVTVTYSPPDIIVPVISISSPSNGQTFTTNIITMSGTAYDNIGLSKIEVKVGSGSWQLASGTTSWSKQVTLSSGTNTIYARATDTSGNVAETSVTITYNPDNLPSISISSPSNGQSFTTNTITVSGIASDDVGVSKVEVKVGTGSWQLASGTTSWSKQVTLSSGSNTIYARATDTSGKTAESSVTVTYIVDGIPSISISSPYSGQSFTTSTVTVSGTASDDVGLSKIEVKVGSGSWQLASGTTSWSKQVTLSSGSNTIYARATDTSGKTAETSVIAVYVAPTVTTSATISLSGISSSYNAGDTLSATVYVKNTGESSHTFPVGFSVKDPNGNWKDVPYKTVTLNPGLSSYVYFTYNIPSAGPAETWTARTAVWDRDAGGGNLQTRYDYKEQSFIVSVSTPSKPTPPIPLISWGGYVYDRENNYPIKDAVVEISGPKSSTIKTDMKGEYKFENLPSGLYTIKISAFGYDTKTETVEVGIAYKLDIGLTPSPVFRQPSDSEMHPFGITYGTLKKARVSSEKGSYYPPVGIFTRYVHELPLEAANEIRSLKFKNKISKIFILDVKTSRCRYFGGNVDCQETDDVLKLFEALGYLAIFGTESVASAALEITKLAVQNEAQNKYIEIFDRLTFGYVYREDYVDAYHIENGYWNYIGSVPTLSPITPVATTIIPQTIPTPKSKLLLPDLVIIDISWTQTEVKKGDKVTFSYVIKNQGNKEAEGTGLIVAPSIPVALFVDNEYITTDFTQPLAAHSQSEDWFIDPWTAKGGTHNVCIKADYYSLSGPNGDVAEDQEDNNQMCKKLSVKGGGLLDWLWDLFR